MLPHVDRGPINPRLPLTWPDICRLLTAEELRVRQIVSAGDVPAEAQLCYPIQQNRSRIPLTSAIDRHKDSTGLCFTRHSNVYQATGCSTHCILFTISVVRHSLVLIQGNNALSYEVTSRLLCDLILNASLWQNSQESTLINGLAINRALQYCYKASASDLNSRQAKLQMYFLFGQSAYIRTRFPATYPP